VKLLFDENLSRKLVVRLAELYPEPAHVAEFDLLECPDRGIWSTDSDFYNLAATVGPPPSDAERVLRREAIRITEFFGDAELGVLVLDLD